MNTSTIIAVVAVVVVLAVAVLAVRPLLRRRRLQERFGPEYDRALESHGNRAAAEHDLLGREKRRKQLDLHPLSPESRDRYAAQWTEVQTRFVDEPAGTVAEADRLVTALMAERGYPTEGYEQQLADLSLEHSSTLEHYRTAHDVYQRANDGQASTEDLRTAMVHYRALFVDLLEPDADTGRTPDVGRRHDTLDRDGRDGRYADRGDDTVGDTVGSARVADRADDKRDASDADVDAGAADTEGGQTSRRHHSAR